MESEHEQFSSFEPESGGANHQRTDEAAANRHAAGQEGQGAERASGETTSTTKRRRWRPARGSSRRNAASAEQATPEAAPEGEQSPAERISETPETSAQDAVSLQREAPGTEREGASDATSTADRESGTDLEPASPAVNFRGAEDEAPAPTQESAQDTSGWREPSISEWPAQAEQTDQFSPVQLDAASDLEATSFGSSGAETASVGDEETIAVPPTLAATPETSAASLAPESAAQEPYESTRAPLSGVEVRPPRRYRFDRPAATAREKHEPVTQPKQASQPVVTEQPATEQAVAQQSAAQQPPPAAAPAQPATNQPARGSQHHPRSHAAAHRRETPVEAAPAAPTSDQSITTEIELELTETPEVEAEVEAAEDLARATQAALEEEVAEALESFTQQEQTASARTNRRRRRRSPTSAPAGTAEPAPEKAAAPQSPITAPQPPLTMNQSFGVSAPPGGQNYQVNNGLQQIGQPQSPFAGPEPSSARGFGPVPRGIASPAERNVRLPRTDRAIETNNVTMNQLAMLFTQAMQQQTDRLLMELRRNQGTPSMTVNFPPMPSNERIGVFVDVANLLYSARNMRIGIDFGRLLDFLRGNRRLIRAHAYCPTSPDPRAEQMFLDAVKGLGYRITTKNYKTFSSGAKKADLDLDMCMDIVRLVDAEAVDCISLVSGDSDFLPLLEYCSDHGVRVEVAAFDEATAGILRQSCDLFINLSLVEDIRA